MQIALLTADIAAGVAANARDVAPLYAGRTVLQHQLELALDLGCERVICFSERPPDELESLRQRCSRAGVPLRLLHRPQELSALVAATDRLLVLACNVLLDEGIVATAAKSSHFVLAVPAYPAVSKGFERIDATRAWAGLMVLPGTAVEELHHLPSDIDPASAMLRVALMRKVPLRELPVRTLSDGSINFPRSAAELQAAEHDRIGRMARPASFAAPMRAVIERLAIRVAPQVLSRSYGKLFLPLAIAAALLLTGLLACIHAPGWAIFALALAYGVITGLRIIRRVGGSDGRSALRDRLTEGFEVAGDLLLIAVLATADELGPGAAENLFAPLILIGLLRLAQRHRSSHHAITASDRVLLTSVLLLAHGAAVLIPVVMLLSLGLLALLFVYETDARDITTT